MTHGSLFSGIGGFDLAAEWMGWQNVFHCEWNSFGQRVLKHYWPKAISYHDITKTDFTIHRGRIDTLTGGFPCQPYSMAGKRLGKEDDRHLWPEMLRAIREIQPRWVVGENVLGLVNWSGGLVFHEVQTDLEAEGYEVQPFVLPAVSVNAPHRRDRVWFVAHARKFRLEQRKASGIVGERQEEICGKRSQFTLQSTSTSEIRDAADTDSCATGTPGEGGCVEKNGSAYNVQQSERREQTEQHNRPSSFSWDAADTGEIRFSSQKPIGELAGGQRLAFTHEQNVWEKFPTVSPICDGNDGVSSRLDGITFSKWRQESIKAGGNAVVPQVVLQIFKSIAEYENQTT